MPLPRKENRPRARPRPRPATRTLHESEWNFSAANVPDGELEACYYYEYAREFAKRSKRWRVLAAQAKRLEGLPRGHGDRNKLSEIYEEMDREFHGGTSYALYTDLVETPWARFVQRVSPALRTRNKLPTPTESACLEINLLRNLSAGKSWAFKTFENWYWEAMSLANWFSSAHSVLDWFGSKWSPGTTDGIKSFSDWFLPLKYVAETVWFDQEFHKRQGNQQREHGLIAVNWNYTDEQLKTKFEQWLKEKRQSRKPVESRRGRNKKRQHLKALGAARLLAAGFTAKEAVLHTEKFLKDKDGDPVGLYKRERSWSMAKRKVSQVIERLFPVVSPKED